MVERLFLAVQWGCLRFVIVVFPDHTHLLFFIGQTGSGPSSTPGSFLCMFEERYRTLPQCLAHLSSPVENQNDLELDFKVFFFVDSCC